MSTASNQHDAWAFGQAADQWFDRNTAVVDPASLDTRPVGVFASHLKPGQHVLEIGCANGHQLERLRRRTGSVGSGIDPSARAIADGASRFPELILKVGTADELAFADASFDAVILGFCCYLIDRRRLHRVVAEVDRVLKPDGLLMITDFDPEYPHRRAFAHQPGLWSYKMQYPQLWLASSAYTLVEKISFSLDAPEFHSDPDKRVASWVLAKHDEGALPIRG